PRAMAGAPAASPRAASARTSRRVGAASFEPLSGLPPSNDPIGPPPNRGRLGQPCTKRRPLLRKSLCALDRDVLERGGIGKPRDQVKGRLADPRANAVDKAELPDRRVNRLLMDEPLHLFEDRRALFVVELVGLLGVELIDVG